MSKCKSCNQELDFPKAVIKQLTTCPFCNAPFRMSDFIEPEILGKPVTAKSVLKSLVKDYGMEIFSKENEHRFRKELMRFPEMLKKERDILQLLLIKEIPSQLFMTIDSPLKEKQTIFSNALNTLYEDFSIPNYAAENMLDLVTDSIKYGVKEYIKEKNYGTFTDPRDGQTYKTVKIGNQVWMAENLKYKIGDSYCYDDNPANCEKYGRLYTWDAAFEACLPGWHLPNIEELYTLIAEGGFAIAGKMLKSRTGWEEYEGKSGNGIDAFGFNFLPAGYRRSDNGNFIYAGEFGGFWSDTEETGYDDTYNAYYIIFGHNLDECELSLGSTGNAISVRCIRD